MSSKYRRNSREDRAIDEYGYARGASNIGTEVDSAAYPHRSSTPPARDSQQQLQYQRSDEDDADSPEKPVVRVISRVKTATTTNRTAPTTSFVPKTMPRNTSYREFSGEETRPPPRRDNSWQNNMNLRTSRDSDGGGGGGGRDALGASRSRDNSLRGGNNISVAAEGAMGGGGENGMNETSRSWAKQHQSTSSSLSRDRVEHIDDNEMDNRKGTLVRGFSGQRTTSGRESQWNTAGTKQDPMRQSQERSSSQKDSMREAQRGRDTEKDVSDDNGDDHDNDDEGSVDTIEDIRRRQQQQQSLRASNAWAETRPPLAETVKTVDWNRSQQQPQTQQQQLAQDGPSATTFAQYSTRKEQQGQILIRKSGRYDDDDDDLEGDDQHNRYPAGHRSTPLSNHKYNSNNNEEHEDDYNEPGHRFQAHAHSENDNDDDFAANVRKQTAMWGNDSGKNGTTSGVAATPGVGASASAAAAAVSLFSASARLSYVHIAHSRGTRTPHVQCTIQRDRTSFQGKLYPTYELILEEPRKSLIIAQKMSMNRTSNYHLFDMTRGQAGNKLSKKSGNYLGKLRARNVNRTGYSLLNSHSDREEVAGVLFDRVTLIDQLTEGNQPRRMTILVPPIDPVERVCVPVTETMIGVDSLTELLQAIEDGERSIPPGFSLLHTKDPVFENGNYRLNFHGRVSLPSVKNFQMVSDDDIENIICQFGKVDKDVFHLDFKAPLNAMQAFALALCQFNL